MYSLFPSNDRQNKRPKSHRIALRSSVGRADKGEAGRGGAGAVTRRQYGRNGLREAEEVTYRLHIHFISLFLFVCALADWEAIALARPDPAPAIPRRG